jgi:protein-tyrosine phosphatase
MLAGQGVDTVVATPHFYIGVNDLNSFVSKRDEAVETLKQALDPDTVRPAIALGAEVQFYSEIYAMEGIDALCISGTNYLLVEMPFAQWTRHTYQTLEHLALSRGIIPIIAHIERYPEFRNDADIILKLQDVNAMIQLNSISFVDRRTKRKALKMLKNGYVNFIGSDCHNLTSRPPDIDEALRVIQKKLGSKGIDVLQYWKNRISERLVTF